MQIVPLYAAVLSFLFIILSIRIIRLRRSLKIGIGHADNETLLRAIRVHSNFSEYVPLGIILLFFLETQNANSWVLHGLCALFTVGRCLHAYGVSRKHEVFVFRIAGMAMTFTTILACAAYLLISAII